MKKITENILVVNLLSASELLMVSPILKNIKKENPESSITLLMNNSNKSISDVVPCVDEFVYFDKQDIKTPSPHQNQNF